MKNSNGRHNYFPKFVSSVVIFFLFPVIYFASIGPQFGFLATTPGPGWSRKPIRRIYQPMFDVAPDFTMRYLRLWRVSDVEAYFILEAAQGEPF